MTGLNWSCLAMLPLLSEVWSSRDAQALLLIKLRISIHHHASHRHPTLSSSLSLPWTCAVETYSGPFKGQTPNGLHRVSTDYTGPYGSGTKLNELDQAAGVHETGTPQLNAIGPDVAGGRSAGAYHGALSRCPPHSS